MALRLRRGTDAERQLITPAEGEIIYTTDTKSVYIGDGTTVGGIIISGEIGLDDLAEVDLSTPPTAGQVLVWDGVKFVPDDVAGVGVVEGSNYRINVIGDDSSTLVDTVTNTLTGVFVGDGSGLTNLPDVVEGSNYRINILSDDSTVIVDTATSTFTGNFVGDGSGLTNLSVSSIFDLNDVFAFTPPDVNDVLIFDGFNFTPQKITIIEGADSTIMVNTNNNTFTGNFNGDLLGGNVISDDFSSILVDSQNFRFSTRNMDIENSSITVTTTDGLQVFGKNISLIAAQIDGSIINSGLLTIDANKFVNDTPVELVTGEYLGGIILVSKSVLDDSAPKAALLSSIDTVTGISPNPAITDLWLEDADGDFRPMFSVNSRGIASASNAFKMTTYTDNQDRDTNIPFPEPGMIVFNQRDDSTGVPQFQGYDGTAWIDLH